MANEITLLGAKKPPKRKRPKVNSVKVKSVRSGDPETLSEGKWIYELEFMVLNDISVESPERDAVMQISSIVIGPNVDEDIDTQKIKRTVDTTIQGEVYDGYDTFTFKGNKDGEAPFSSGINIKDILIFFNEGMETAVEVYSAITVYN